MPKWAIFVVAAGTTLGVVAGRMPATTALGEIRGTVTFGGSVPEPRVIDMSGDAYCFGVRGEPLMHQTVLTGADGELANVLIYIKGEVEGEFPVPQDEVLLDQEGCMYEPQVVALRVAQTLAIRNSDATMHNVHVFSERNRGFNVGQPIKGLTSRKRFRVPELGIDVKCDIHGWMQGYLAVFDHPFFSVTAEQGAFAFDGVPAGDYVLEAWHGTLGTQIVHVTVTADGVATVAFEFQ